MVYLRHEMEVRGPLTPSELLGKVVLAKWSPRLACVKDDSAWFPATRGRRLFDAATKPTIIWRCPGVEASWHPLRHVLA